MFICRSGVQTAVWFQSDFQFMARSSPYLVRTPSGTSIRCFDFPKIQTMSRIIIQNSSYQNKNREKVKNREIRYSPDHLCRSSQLEMGLTWQMASRCGLHTPVTDGLHITDGVSLWTPRQFKPYYFFSRLCSIFKWIVIWFCLSFFVWLENKC